MLISKRELFLEIHEIDNAVDCLELAYDLLSRNPLKSNMWQFIVIALFQALNTFCVCLLQGTSGYSVYQKPRVKKDGAFTDKYIKLIEWLRDNNSDLVKGIDHPLDEIPEWNQLSQHQQIQIFFAHDHILSFSEIFKRCQNSRFIHPPIVVSNEDEKRIKNLKGTRNSLIHYRPCTSYSYKINSMKEECLSVSQIILQMIQREEIKHLLRRNNKYESCLKRCEETCDLLD